MARILIVDDDQLMRLLLRETLEAQGHYVVQLDRSTHVAEALIAHAPDLLMLDLMMPQCNGNDVLTGIRAWGATLPTILMSAYLSESTGPEWVERVKSLEPIFFLAKPFSPDDLLAVVAEALMAAGREA